MNSIINSEISTVYILSIFRKFQVLIRSLCPTCILSRCVYSCHFFHSSSYCVKMLNILIRYILYKIVIPHHYFIFQSAPELSPQRQKRRSFHSTEIININLDQFMCQFYCSRGSAFLENLAKNSANCVKLVCKKQCEMRQIGMQKTVRNASNWYAKNSAKCVKFVLKKTVRNASNSSAKNTAKYFIFLQILLQILRCFLHINMAHFSVFFAGKLTENWMAILYIFQAFSWWFFMGSVRRDGKGGIPVKSRWKCGHPDRDCTENTRFCSAMSTKSEIVKVMPEKRLNPRSNRKPPV